MNEARNKPAGAESLALEVALLERHAVLQGRMLAAGALVLALLAAALGYVLNTGNGNGGGGPAALADSAEQYLMTHLFEVRQAAAARILGRSNEIADYSGSVLRDQVPDLRYLAERMFKESISKLLIARQGAMAAALKAALGKNPELLASAARRLAAGSAEADRCLKELASALEPAVAAELDRTLGVAMAGLEGLPRQWAAANALPPATPMAEILRDGVRLAKQFSEELNTPAAAPKLAR